MNTKPIRYATINEVSYLPAYFVTIYQLMPEGHYQCISHAPFGNQPKFNTLAEAKAFISHSSVSPKDITISTNDPRPVPFGC